MKKQHKIFTSRLCLDDIFEYAREDFTDLISNDEISKTFILPDFKFDDDKIALFERLKQLSLSDERLIWGIYLENRLCGFINEVDKSESFVEVGYVIHPSFSNRGYATEALEAFIKEAFRLGFPTVRAGAFEENEASMKVMKKCSMKKIDHSEIIEYRGKNHNCIYYEIKREEKA